MMHEESGLCRNRLITVTSLKIQILPFRKILEKKLYITESVWNIVSYIATAAVMRIIQNTYIKTPI